MKKTLLLAISLIVICLIAYFLIPHQDIRSETVVIGGAFSLTGFSAEWGEASRNGAFMAIEEINNSGGINGRQLELKVEDTKYTEAGSIGAVRKLSDVDGARYIIGPTWLDGLGGPRALTVGGKILMIAPDSLAESLQRGQSYPYIFSTWYRADKEMEMLARFAKDDGVKKLATFTAKEDFFAVLTRHLQKSTKDAGIQLAGTHESPLGTSDFRTELLKAKQEEVEAAYFGFDDEKSLMSFLKQRRELFPKLKLYATESFIGFAARDEFQDLAAGVVVVAPADVDHLWAERYKARFGVDPIFSASNTYDAVRILAEALKSGAKTPIEVKTHLSTHKFETVTFGFVGFNEENGIEGGSFVRKEIRNGKAVAN